MRGATVNVREGSQGDFGSNQEHGARRQPSGAIPQALQPRLRFLLQWPQIPYRKNSCPVARNPLGSVGLI